MKTLNTYITEKFIDVDNYKTKKYELTENTENHYRTTIYRIRALKTFKTVDGKTVKAGDLGGWVESEDNLSQKGKCWVAGDAIVCDNAEVYDNALVSGYAYVYGDAKVYDNAQVYGGNANVYGNAKICGSAKVNYIVNSGKIDK